MKEKCVLRPFSSHCWVTSGQQPPKGWNKEW